MRILKKQLTCMAGLLVAGALVCGQAAATTVSYNFVDPGWVNMAGTSESFSGSFVGTPEANGDVALNDLTVFIGFLMETNAQGQTKTISTFGDAMGTTGLSGFFFDPNANTLSLAANGTPGAQICLGDAVAQGACGLLGPRPVGRNGVPEPPPDGLFISLVNGSLSSYDFNLPQITFAPPSGSAAPQPAQTTPEPASSLLCGGALVLVSLGLRSWGRRKRERSANGRG